MEENKDNDLMNGLEHGLSELEELEDWEDLGSDFDSLLSDSENTVDGGTAAEFDGLMDLSDFEDLGSSEDIAGLDTLFDMNDNEWESELSSGQQETPTPAQPDQADLMLDQMLDSFDDTGSLTFSEEERKKEKENENNQPEIAVSEGEFKEPEDTGSLNAVPNALAEEKPQDEIEELLNIAGADLEESPNLAGIEQVNDELLLDIPELDPEEREVRQSGKKKKIKPKTDAERKRIWERLFGNVPDENAEKRAAKEAARQAEKEAKKAPKKTKEEIALEKEEAKKAKEEAAAAKKAEQEEKKAQKEALKKQKAEEKAAKKAAAAEALAAEEAKEPPTRINRAGASIVFVTFAVIGLSIIVGNNSYAYSQCIAKAAAFFGQKEYTEAYNQIYGVQVKEDDMELKDQVMTVMFIQKQLNSFDNYFAMEQYPEALDSLLKGLDKYEKYLDQARSLGIESDLNYVRAQIISELKSAFNISGNKAKELLAISDPEEYTKQVTKIVNS